MFDRELFGSKIHGAEDISIDYIVMKKDKMKNKLNAQNGHHYT